jgi:hypothetical protein
MSSGFATMAAATTFQFPTPASLAALGGGRLVPATPAPPLLLTQQAPLPPPPTQPPPPPPAQQQQPFTPIVSVNVDGSKGVQQALSSIRRALVYPPPRGWEDSVKEEDHDVCAEIIQAQIQVHKTSGDSVYETDVQILEIGTGTGVTFYRLRVFGLKDPITLEDMLSLKQVHSRVGSVYYDPMAQGADKELRGALVCMVSSASTDRMRQLALSATPPLPTPETAAAAGPSDKKRKIWLPWG